MRGDLPKNSIVECQANGDDTIQCELKMRDRDGDVSRKAFIRAVRVKGTLVVTEAKGEEQYLDSLRRFMSKRLVVEED